MNQRDPRVYLLARQVAQCCSIHNVATALMDAGTESWDCMMVFYETIDVVGHHFMQHYPPRMEHVSPQDFQTFRHVVPGIYELQDAMLGRLLELAGPDTAVILLSDHGFHSDHLRPRVQASLEDPHAAMDATWHRPLGVLAMAGPGIGSGRAVYGASVLDIAPTALTLLGLPIGADMNGRVLVEALDSPGEIERVFSWDDVAGEAGLHPPDLRINPFEARDAMAQLADLGYVSDLPADSRAQVALCDRETRFNLGVVYMTTSRQNDALAVFQSLATDYPNEPRFSMNYAHCLYAGGRYGETVAALDALTTRFPDVPDVLLLRGGALFAQGKLQEATQDLERALERSPDRPDLLCTIADAYTRLKRWEDAARLLDRAAKIDPHDPMVHLNRARLALARGQFEQAAEESLRAVELRHFLPEAHYTLGVALTWLKDYDHAIKSFKAALSMQPGMLEANRFVASIYRHLNDRFSARPYREAADRIIQARNAGMASAADVLIEPPMGPQEWAKKFLDVEDGS
jgi:tetratricopeptide (TPR) repeat protein